MLCDCFSSKARWLFYELQSHGSSAVSLIGLFLGSLYTGPFLFYQGREMLYAQRGLTFQVPRPQGSVWEVAPAKTKTLWRTSVL